MKSETCEWCKSSYPKGYEDYWEIELFGTDKHIICDDCFRHLKLTRVKK